MTRRPGLVQRSLVLAGQGPARSSAAPLTVGLPSPVDAPHLGQLLATAVEWTRWPLTGANELTPAPITARRGADAERDP
jgi:hypothetical protein